MNEKENGASGLLTRRGALVAGAVAVGGVILARRFPKILPPTCGNVLRAGDTFTYGMQKALLSDRALVKEYRPEDLTSFPATGTTDPGANPKEKELSESYRRLKEGAFARWRLPVGGHVARPREFTLDELKRFPSRTQITRHTCEEGWSAIGQWTGVPLSAVLDAAGVLATARFVLFTAYDGWVDSIDMFDARHPQTVLAYGMNGRDLPIPHGAPVRLRVERQMGYKSMKFLRSITVADKFEDGGEKGNIQAGWAWYTGI
jgi:DMSO/TMAO reductase YedYZ molybdopterin-dependent catalytic subunit